MSHSFKVCTSVKSPFEPHSRLPRWFSPPVRYHSRLCPHQTIKLNKAKVVTNRSPSPFCATACFLLRPFGMLHFIPLSVMNLCFFLLLVLFFSRGGRAFTGISITLFQNAAHQGRTEARIWLVFLFLKNGPITGRLGLVSCLLVPVWSPGRVASLWAVSVLWRHLSTGSRLDVFVE